MFVLYFAFIGYFFSELDRSIQDAEGARYRRERARSLETQVFLLRSEHRLARPGPAKPPVCAGARRHLGRHAPHHARDGLRAGRHPSAHSVRRLQRSQAQASLP